MRTDAKLEREVAGIGDLSREELVARWVAAYGCPPPKGVKRGLLERSAAWHLQAKRLGGLSAHARRAIRQYVKQKEAERRRPEGAAAVDGSEPAVAFADGSTPIRQSTASPGTAARSATATIKPPPTPGTRLMREWNGRMHVVDITEDGILFDGKLYRSLSAVAKRITGAHWSGPRFFGL
jgi:hypothetical protein